MRMSKCLGAAICLALLALTGCHPSQLTGFQTPPASSFAPTASSSETAASSSVTTRGSTFEPGDVAHNGTAQWIPTGKSFQIYWYDHQNPCLESEDSLVSDGKSVVTCHVHNMLKTGKTYAYDVGKPTKKSKKDVAPPSNGTFYMHVGGCGNCPTAPFPNPQTPSPQTAEASAAQSNTKIPDIKVSCPSPGGLQTPTKVDPLAVNGLKAGNIVYFQFIGSDPTSSSPPDTTTTVTLQTPGFCDNIPSTEQGEYCQVSKAAKDTTYTAQAFGCGPNTTPSLKANQ